MLLLLKQLSFAFEEGNDLEECITSVREGEIHRQPSGLPQKYAMYATNTYFLTLFYVFFQDNKVNVVAINVVRPNGRLAKVWPMIGDFTLSNEAKRREFGLFERKCVSGEGYHWIDKNLSSNTVLITYALCYCPDLQIEGKEDY